MIHMLRGKTYMVGERGDKHFFAWSTDDSFFEELPEKNFVNEKSGIQWFKTHNEAFDAYIDATKEEEIKWIKNKEEI